MYNYDSNGLITKGLWYLLNGQRNSINFYTVDEKGKIVEKFRIFSEGRISSNKYFYDGSNHLINSLRRYAEGNSAVFRYAYDENRKLTHRTGMLVEGEKIVEKYYYDQEGHLASAEWTNFDSWLTGTIRFEYNDHNQLATAHFAGAGSKSEFEAAIEFSYDTDKNLEEIQWDLPEDDFQKYTFEYVNSDETLTRSKPQAKLLNQNSPGDEPAIFAPGIASDGLSNRDVAITPDGREIYFCTSSNGFQFATILCSKLVDDIWTKPEVVSFGREPHYLYFEPCISHDGSKMLFLSTMPKDSTENKGDEDIWCVDREGDDWGEPYNLGAPVNTNDREFYPSLTTDNTLYFTRTEEGTRESFIYRSKFIEGKYSEPEKLPPQVNCGANRFNAYIAADESYIIVPSLIEEHTIGGVDYYIVFRNDDDTWSEPVNLGQKINSATGQEWSASISPDGRYFFFMANRRRDADEQPDALSYDFFRKLQTQPNNGNCDIYWVETEFIEQLKRKVESGHEN